MGFNASASPGRKHDRSGLPASRSRHRRDPSVIDGATRLLVIVGDPVNHVRSPSVYNPLIARAGRNVILVPWHAPAQQFAAVMHGLMRTENLDGILVTYPFKQQAMALADAIAPMGIRVGAVNALRREPDGRWTGGMFDGLGLVRALQRHGQHCAGRRAVVIGAGGAGSAIAFALAHAGASSIRIHDQDPRRASELVLKLRRWHPEAMTASGDVHLDGVDLLINATPVGIDPGHGLPTPIPQLGPEVTVVDIVPASTPTALSRLARASGCAHLAADAMVEGQAEAVLEFFGIIPSARSRIDPSASRLICEGSAP